MQVIYGCNHIDYLMSVSIRRLHKYKQWCCANHQSIQVLPNVDIIVNEVCLSPDNAEHHIAALSVGLVSSTMNI